MAVIEQELVRTDARPATNPVSDIPATNPVSDILDRAADLIERDGWFGDADINGCLRYEGDEPRCAIVALVGTTGGGWKPDSLAAADSLADYLGLGGFGHIPSWNNTPGRTKAEVVTALRCAAVAAAR